MPDTPITKERFHSFREKIEEAVEKYRSDKGQANLNSFTTDERWRALAAIGDWNKSLHSDKKKFVKFSKKWGVDWRDKNFSLNAEDRYPNRKHVQQFIRSLARFYLFIAPTSEVLRACQELCHAAKVMDLLPGSLLIGSGPVESMIPRIDRVFKITLFDLLLATDYAPAIAEFARFGFCSHICLLELLKGFGLLDQLSRSWHLIDPPDIRDSLLQERTDFEPLIYWLTDDVADSLKNISYTGNPQEGRIEFAPREPFEEGENLRPKLELRHVPDIYFPNWILRLTHLHEHFGWIDTSYPKEICSDPKTHFLYHLNRFSLHQFSAIENIKEAKYVKSGDRDRDEKADKAWHTRLKQKKDRKEARIEKALLENLLQQPLAFLSHAMQIFSVANLAIVLHKSINNRNPFVDQSTHFIPEDRAVLRYLWARTLTQTNSTHFIHLDARRTKAKLDDSINIELNDIRAVQQSDLFAIFQNKASKVSREVNVLDDLLVFALRSDESYSFHAEPLPIIRVHALRKPS